jgi:hypothetical protein
MRTLSCFLLVASAAAQGDPKNGNVEMVNDPAGCASDLADAVAAITAASSHIVQGVAACPPQADDKEKLCAAAITLAITQFSLASQKLSSSARTCANTIATVKGSTCGEDVSDTIKQFGVTSAFLIAATESCKPPSEGGTAFGCVSDVVDVVDALANSAEGINDAVKSCGAVREMDKRMIYLYKTWLATGCPSLPSPDWIQWGYWYADSRSQFVMQAMYDWCLEAKVGGNPHASQMCCASTSCPAASCSVQKSFVGTRLPMMDKVRSDKTQLQDSWPLTLE